MPITGPRSRGLAAPQIGLAQTLDHAFAFEHGCFGRLVGCDELRVGNGHECDRVTASRDRVTRDADHAIWLAGKLDVKGKVATFTLGYSHSIEFLLPEGVDMKVDKQTHIVLTGYDRQMLGQVAANMRSLRPPDPYKNKGVRYTGEPLRKKVGKSGTGGKPFSKYAGSISCPPPPTWKTIGARASAAIAHSRSSAMWLGE